MFDRANFADTCPQRANVIEWLPFKEGESVVIHSSAPAAVINMLRDKKVQLQILSEPHLEKLALNPGKGSLDWILVLGMEVDARFLGGLYRKLKPEGRLVVLLHNTFGMSYLAGKPAIGQQYYAAVEGRTGRAANDNKSNPGGSVFYSYKGMKKLFELAGIGRYSRYYPDSDGDFAVNIYSDRYLPKAGDCSVKVRNFTYDRLAMFDELRGLNLAAQDGMYTTFANDFLVITGEALPQVMVRYSNDRAPVYQIKTEICQYNALFDATAVGQCQAAAGLMVNKIPLHAHGAEHVMRMTESYEALCEQYDAEAFTIVPCTQMEGYVAFPYVKGVALSELMQQALQKGDEDTVFTLFHTYLSKLRKGRETGFSNYDFIFSNILIDGDNWQVIDYEWTVDKAVSAEELAFRAAYCFSLEHSDFPFEDICKILDFDKVRVEQLISKERSYQQSITGSQASLDSLCEEHGGDVYTREALVRSLELSTKDHRVQIYQDSGNGFQEAQSYFVEHALTCHDEMELTLKISTGMKAVRIDPCEEPCLVQIKKLWWNGKEQFLDKQIEINGTKGKAVKNSYPEYVFATKDPNFGIELDKLPESGNSQNELKLQLEIHKISLQLANALTKSMKRII